MGATDLGEAAARVKGLANQADLNSHSIRSSYSGLFNSKSTSNPLQLLRKAKAMSYGKLGDDFFHSGSSLKEVADSEVEQLIINALGKNSGNTEVRNYAKHLLDSKSNSTSELRTLTKKVMKDFEDGVDPSIVVPNAAGTNTGMAIKIDRPVASYGGSPAFDMKKTFSIDTLDDFNKQHQQFVQKYDDAVDKAAAHRFGPDAIRARVAKVQAESDLRASAKFRDAFGHKLPTTSGRMQIDTPRITLKDMNSFDEAEAFFRNPMARGGTSALSPTEAKVYTDNLLAHVRREIGSKGDSPLVIKNAIITKLDEFAKDPGASKFLDTFHFARYSADEMKDVVGVLKGSKNAVAQEYLRLGADAGAVVGGGALAGLGITNMLNNSNSVTNTNFNR